MNTITLSVRELDMILTLIKNAQDTNLLVGQGRVVVNIDGTREIIIQRSLVPDLSKRIYVNVLLMTGPKENEDIVHWTQMTKDAGMP